MKRKVVLTTVSIVVLLLTAGLIEQHQIRALDSPSQPETKLIQVSSEEEMSLEEKLTAGNTKFALNLFQEIIKQDSQKNIFISPSSIAFALAMTYNGAAGETQQEMLATLELLGMSDAEINSANQALHQSLETVDPQVKLSIANSIWARDNVDFKSNFLDTNQQFYEATVSKLDFADPKSPGVINGWVSENTQGKIPQIVERLQVDDILFLINAIYFKGNWPTKFDPAQTTEQPFFLADGSIKQHLLMSTSAEYGYYENEQFQAVNLPYGEGRLSMYVFLPRPDSNLEEFYQQLTPESWEQWLKRFFRRRGNVKLPRFKLEYEIGLKDTLQTMGMVAAFDLSQADFSPMIEIPVAIGGVKHKTFVEVNEEGTEAAAATSVGMVTTSMPPPPFQMRVDRPFFVAIRDNQTGTILFMGSIVEPKL